MSKDPLVMPINEVRRADRAMTEDEIRANWHAYFDELDKQYSQGRTK